VFRVVAGVLGSSFIFFLVSNLGCWVGSTIYAQDFSGLIICYIAGIPFAKATILGDFIYSGILFGAFYSAQLRFSKLQQA